MVVAHALPLLKRCGEVVWSHLRYRTEFEGITDELRARSDGSFVRLPLGAVHYEIGGPETGPTVLLVHGFSVPYYIWDPTFDALTRAGFRVLRYDLYGRGLSDRPTIPYNEGLFDRQILDLLKALSINDKIDLIGVSMGGPISATFANRHAMKVRSLTLIDPGYQTGRKAPLRLRIPVLGELVMKTVVAPWLPASQLRDFHNPEQFSDWPEKFRQQMRYKGFRRALLSTIRLYAGRDTRTDYAQVGRSQLPVLLIWGEGDKAVSARIHDSIQLLIPQATSHVIKAAAHLPHLERPQDVNPILLSFLQNGYR